jgi:hypothetical protein
MRSAQENQGNQKNQMKWFSFQSDKPVADVKREICLDYGRFFSGRTLLNLPPKFHFLMKIVAGFTVNATESERFDTEVPSNSLHLI